MATYADGLREIADWLDEHNIDPPHQIPKVQLSIYDFSEPGADRNDEAVIVAAIRDAAKELAKGAPIGAVVKEPGRDNYTVSRKLPSGGVVMFYTSTNPVCEKVETGEMQEVVRFKIPDEVYAKYRTVELVPVTKVECRPLLSLGDV